MNPTLWFALVAIAVTAVAVATVVQVWRNRASVLAETADAVWLVTERVVHAGENPVLVDGAAAYATRQADKLERLHALRILSGSKVEADVSVHVLRRYASVCTSKAQDLRAA